MNKYVIFEKRCNMNLVKDLKQDVLNKILEKVQNINRMELRNKFNSSDIFEFISFENFNDNSKKNICCNDYDFLFHRLEVDYKIHKSDREFLMHKDIYQNKYSSFLKINFEISLFTEAYLIESNNLDVLKIEGISKEINLKNFPFILHFC